MASRYTSRRFAARWIAPLAVAAVILGGGAAAHTLASANRPALKPASAATLIADLAAINVDGIQGTVVEHADLGLPDLPSSGRTDFQSLISGTHTLKIWSAGPTKIRVALLGDLAESDLIRNGSDVWLWSSAKNTAAHASIPARSAAPTPSATPSLPASPQEAVALLLKLIGPSTSVTLGDHVTVAGQPAYQLVIAPRNHTSLVADIKVAVDAANHVPLRVQVFAKNYAPPAFEIGFTQVSFDRPSERVFSFTPPAGAKVTELRPHSGNGDKTSAKPQTATTGSDWTTIVAARPAQLAQLDNNPQAKVLLSVLPTVRGSFGTGKLLTTRLLTVLILDDGRIIAGAVDPAKVVAAASDPKLALPK